MTKFFRYLWLLLLLSICFISCRKDKLTPSPVAPENFQPYNFSQVFQAFWEGMQYNYVFWDNDNTNVNWKDVYKKYQPIFASLDIENYEDILEGVEYFKQITRNLSDGHFAITFNDSRLNGLVISPSRLRKQFRDWSGYISQDQILNKNPGIYFNTPYYKTEKGIKALAGTINDSILYLYFDRFQLKQFYENETPNDVQGILNYFWTALKQEKIKRWIIDVRGNAGGDIGDLNFFISRVISTPLTFGSVKYKAGNNRLDYTPWLDGTIKPASEAFTANKPVTILADGRSASMAELTTMALRILPGSIVVGDTTWGATGIFPGNYNSQLYNGGPFIAAKFVNVYTPAAAFKYIDNKSYEKSGFPPDIRILNSSEGRDEQLEKALGH